MVNFNNAGGVPNILSDGNVSLWVGGRGSDGGARTLQLVQREALNDRFDCGIPKNRNLKSSNWQNLLLKKTALPLPRIKAFNRWGILTIFA